MIDERELRIGSHILIDGERKRVDYVSYGEIGEIYMSDPNWSRQRKAEEHSKHTWKLTQIEPIPITEELLQELGFEYRSDRRDWHKYIGEAWIGIHLLLDRERVRINVCDDSADYGNLLCRYLHEIENFVFLTLHKELIEK